jgi:hypothetical protein
MWIGAFEATGLPPLQVSTTSTRVVGIENLEFVEIGAAEENITAARLEKV